VGAKVKRVEDPRFLRGRANYVDDLHLPGTLHVAFVRSSHAHGRIRGIDSSVARARGAEVFTGADIASSMKPMGLPLRKESFPLKVYKPCAWPCLATGKVRHVGEPVAAVVAASRYLAEDLAELVQVDYEPLPAVLDPEAALRPGAPVIHEELGDNLAMQVDGSAGDVDGAFRRAVLVLRERFTTNRHCALPLEGRVVVAAVGSDGILTVWTSSQTPHIVRSRVADVIGFPEQRLRVLAPDVGGGFGLKCHVFPEEALISFIATRLGAPIKWTEDRQENLIGSFHAKDDLIDAEMGFAADGTILGMRCNVIGDLGAYGADPWPSCLEAIQLAMCAPGPYKIKDYAWDVRTVTTNKTTLSVYRGVGAPAATLIGEHLVDRAAQRLGIDPAEIRRRNMIRPEEFPYTSVTGSAFDSGSSTNALEKALEAVDYDGFGRRREEARARGKQRGIGISTYIEATTFGTAWWNVFGIQHSAYESAEVRMEPNGGVTVSVGTHSHGQGHATTFAQLVADELGIEVKDVNLVQGDTQATPYGWGTWGSRGIVAGGGAVVGAARKVREKMLRVAAHLLEVSADDLELERGRVQVKGIPSKSVTVKAIAQAAVFSAWQLPKGEEPGLEATHYWDPPVPYANATHVAEVEVDSETGHVEICRYVVAEDCGTVINPTIVAAQVVGGVAQGIGCALYEHMPYSEAGQPLATSLMDYLVPSAADIPDIEVRHIETPSPLTPTGMKGMGEGGTIGSPAAIVNAVASALNATITTMPLTPERVWQLANAKAA
jgi:carbon-monoxide dehydrogenase large subunit